MSLTLSACALRQPDTVLTLVPNELGTPMATAAPQAETGTRIPQLPSPTPSPTAAPVTWTPAPSLPATWTAAPALPATWTPAPDQSQYWTAIPAGKPRVDAALPPKAALATWTPKPTPTKVQPTVAARDIPPQETTAPAWSPPQTLRINAASAYEFAVAPGQPFAHGSVQLTDGVRLFLPNPADDNSYLHTDDKGILRYRAPGQPAAQEMKWSPFHAGYSAGIESYDRNKHRVVELDWSADGSRFSFRIDTPPGLDNSAAGVWHWRPEAHPVHGATFQLIRDCAHDGYRPCGFVNPSNARHWRTVKVEWSPVAGDTRILLTVRLPEENRNALAMTRAVADIAYANNAPPFARYDYGHWDMDGQGIVVSGRRPDGRAVIAQVNGDLSGERVILDGAARGLWLRNAARLPNGDIVALGRSGAPNAGPVALYDMQGRRISDFVGDSAPDRVSWHPDRSAVVLIVAGRQYTARVADGAIYDSSELAANPRFGAQP